MQNAFLSPEEEKPLKTCLNCKEQPCTIKGNPQYGKICAEVEALLNTKEIRGYTPRHLRNKERQFSITDLDRIAGKRAFQIKFGNRKIPSHLQEED